MRQANNFKKDMRELRAAANNPAQHKEYEKMLDKMCREYGIEVVAQAIIAQRTERVK